jgi:hypothetical protein
MKPSVISDSEWKNLAETRRSEQFLAACRLPGIWLHRAAIHKRGADALYEIAYTAAQRDLARLLADSDRKTTGSTSRTLEGPELEDFNDRQLLGEYFLLIGYGLECLLKGYLLAIIPELVVDERRLDKLVATHDLAQLCYECGIQLAVEEERLLKLITRHIVWANTLRHYTYATCQVGLRRRIRKRSRSLYQIRFMSVEYKCLPMPYLHAPRCSCTRAEVFLMLRDLRGAWDDLGSLPKFLFERTRGQLRCR